MRVPPWPEPISAGPAATRDAPQTARDVLELVGIDGGVIGYTARMAKHLVDIDESALAAAQAELGTPTMKDTVNEALRRASAGRDARVEKALDRLGRRELAPREQAWR